MEFIVSILCILVGFLFLIKGADIFVDGASNVARKFGVPSIVIGLTIVAIGTSLPEMMVSIASSLAGKNDMSIANVTGSNLFNICMVLAISNILMNNKYSEKISISEKIKSFFRVVFLIDGDVTSRYLILANIMLLFGSVIDGKLGRIDGLILLTFAVSYILALIKNSKSSTNSSEDESESTVSIPMVKQIVLMILGAVGIVIGGDLVVESATKIGEIVGLSENVIGLTIVAMGTSLPELVTSLVAVKKGEADIALGNALGSNIVNIVIVLGLSSLISPIAVAATALVDMIIALIITLTVAAILFKRNNVLSKNVSVIYVAIYIVYTIFAIIR